MLYISGVKNALNFMDREVDKARVPDKKNPVAIFMALIPYWIQKMPEIVKDKDRKEYVVTLDTAQIRIGGRDENTNGKFVPNINMQRWNNECWLNLNNPDVVTEQVEVFEKGKIELEIGSRIHRFYIAENQLIYDVVFNHRPIMDEIRISMLYQKGLAFFYQPPLTEEEVCMGMERPVNVVGSYAVYWNRRNNQYKTGKFCHIYRPRLTDCFGNRTWADVEVKGKQLIFKMDEAWLDAANYPITLG